MVTPLQQQGERRIWAPRSQKAQPRSFLRCSCEYPRSFATAFPFLSAHRVISLLVYFCFRFALCRFLCASLGRCLSALPRAWMESGTRSSAERRGSKSENSAATLGCRDALAPRFLRLQRRRHPLLSSQQLFLPRAEQKKKGGDRLAFTFCYTSL